MQGRMVRPSRSSGSSSMVDGDVLKSQWTIPKIMGTVGLMNEELEVKEDVQKMEMVKVTELMASSGLRPQMVESIRKVLEEMCCICLFDDVDQRELVDEHRLTNAVCLLKSVNLALSDPPY